MTDEQQHDNDRSHADDSDITPRDLFVTVYCPTGATFTEPGQVAFDLPDANAKVTFRNPSPRETLCITKHHNLPGLLAKVEMPERSGSSIDHAYEARQLCDAVVSSAFALTLADMKKSFPVFIVDATKRLVDRPFVHWFSDHLVVERRADLNPTQWIEQTTAFYAGSKRTIRAVHWLRKMFAEDDLLDRFLAGWTGLETLNPELCKHFDVAPSADDVRECNNCGESLIRKVPRATGLKELFIREGQESLYHSCSKARNGLVHGNQDIESLTSLAGQHTSDIGLLLAKGIRALSGVQIPTDPKHFEWLNGFRIASFVFLQGTMNFGELEDYELEHKELPLLEFEMRHEKGHVDGKPVLNSEANILPPKDCSLVGVKMGASGPVTMSNLQGVVSPAEVPTRP